MQAQAQAAVKGVGAWQDGAAPRGLCLFDAGWHQGVVGLVASRIKDRPAARWWPLRRRAMAWSCAARRAPLPACTSATCWRPSPRAMPGLIERFGGHAMAAGLTIDAAGPGPLRPRLRNRSGRAAGAGGIR